MVLMMINDCTSQVSFDPGQDDIDDDQARGLSERYLEEILRAAALHGYVQFCSPSIFHSFIFTNTNTKTLNPLLAIV